ncbi:translationally-controlled tumor protein homolog [Clarias gariepinus]|uniref:translationally-controlled tumor protein homolog n=1 Tax=Clarias gariepinus TaxID=13013 RepID=UPI00234DC52F|nr:translationally-controlled tumor protein homolog [Clarias gariepinus]
MIIYRDIITGDEMFSDIYRMKFSENGMMIEVEGKMVSRSEGAIDDALIGGNASAEVLDEGCDTTTVSGVDIILNHKLQETSYDKKSYTVYIKEYMKAVKAKLQETAPDRVEPFMAHAQAEVKKILGKFKDYQFYTGESMNPDGAIGLLDFRADGVTPYMLFFKDGLEMEKC